MIIVMKYIRIECALLKKLARHALSETYQRSLSLHFNYIEVFFLIGVAWLILPRQLTLENIHEYIAEGL